MLAPSFVIPPLSPSTRPKVIIGGRLALARESTIVVVMEFEDAEVDGEGRTGKGVCGRGPGEEQQQPAATASVYRLPSASFSLLSGPPAFLPMRTGMHSSIAQPLRS